MGTVLKYLKHAFWYLALHKETCVLQNHLWWPGFLVNFVKNQ